MNTQDEQESNEMEIVLTQGCVTRLSKTDSALAKLKWHTAVNGKLPYATISISTLKKHNKLMKTFELPTLDELGYHVPESGAVVQMQRLILGESPYGYTNRHLDGNTLNNTRENLAQVKNGTWKR